MNQPPPPGYQGPIPGGPPNNCRPPGPQNMPMQLPMQKMPIQMPIRQHIPQHMPQHMPQNMPQNMLQNMPQNMHPVQNRSRVSNVMPHKIMAEPTAEKLLTEFHAYTIRKTTPSTPREIGTWAIADIIKERLADSEIFSQIKRLDAKKESVSSKKMALKPHQTSQVDSILDSLDSHEMNPNFGWSLVQLDSRLRDIPNRERGEKKKKETVTITVYVKRAPLPGRNPVMLHAQMEQDKLDAEREEHNQKEHEKMTLQRARSAEREHQEHQHRMMMEQQMRQSMPPPPPQHPQTQFQQHNQQGPHGAPGPPIGLINLGKNGGGQPKMGRKNGNFKKNYHNDSDSSQSSYSDSRSGSESDESSRSSVSSDRKKTRRHSIHKGITRSHSQQRPAIKKYRDSRSPSPDRRLGDTHRIGAYGGSSQRPYASEVPRTASIPQNELLSAYHKGKEDTYVELLRSSERQTSSPAVIERILARPQQYQPPVITYDHAEPRFEEPRRLESRRIFDDREQYVDDLYRDDEYSIRGQEAEEYMRSPSEPRGEYRQTLDPRLSDRRQSSPIASSRLARPLQSPIKREFVRRPSISSPVRPSINHPFAPKGPNPLRRTYEPSMASSFDREFREPYRGPYRETFHDRDRGW